MIGLGMRSLWEIAVLFSPPMTLPDFRVGNAASICARSAGLEVEIAERGLAPATGAPFTGSESKPEIKNVLPLKLTLVSAPRSAIAPSARS